MAGLARTLDRRGLARGLTLRWSWEQFGLAVVLLLAAGLNLFRLDQNGYSNEYYAAAVRSMLQSWHNFFFASFDPGGFVTVDKPAAGLWLQTASAWLFGYTGVSLLLPQALAGVVSVAVVYHVVRRSFGVSAGLLAGLALALTPVAVAVNRANELDAQVACALVLAAWAVTMAAERGSLRWLLLGAVLVGIGFNVKMLQAYLPLPALVATYLLGAPIGWRRRLSHLCVAGLVTLVVSLLWAVAVDLTPAEARPYIGSSQHNSVLELMVGYNGLNRLLGGGGPGGGPGGPPPGGGAFQGPPPAGFAAGQAPAAAPAVPPAGFAGQPASPAGGQGVFAGPGGPPGGGPGGPAGFGAGAPGVFRLFGGELAGQISWLLPLAGLGLVAAALAANRRLPLGRREQALLLWGGWLLTTGAAFSAMRGIFHPYYTVMLAPAVAALAGIGGTQLWRSWRDGNRTGWLLPATIVAGAALHLHIVADYPDWSRWLTPAIAGLTALSLLLLGAWRWRPTERRLGALAAVAIVAAVGVGPAAWAVTPIQARMHFLPSAGPTAAGPGGQGPGRQGDDGPGGAPSAPGATSGDASGALLAYLRANRGDARFLLAVSSAMEASSLIIETGEPVMAIGGFSGGDPILTPATTADLVRQGTVRYFRLGRGMGGPPGQGAGFLGRGADDAVRQPAAAADAPLVTSPVGGPVDAPGGGEAQPPQPDVNGSVAAWVQQACEVVPAALWQGATAGGTGPAGGAQLYDCAPAVAAGG